MKSNIENFDSLPDTALVNKAAARELFGGLSETGIWRWIKAGIIPAPVKISGRPHWTAGSIRQTLAALAAQEAHTPN